MPSKSSPSTDRWSLPALPAGRTIELPGRGTTFVRQLDGPDDLPVILLHGWTATADLNWATCYDAVGSRFPVVALDQRGHGQGIRSPRRFRLADCADDVAALADVLGIERFIVVGYSMGGCVAQLVALRHPSRVAGLVLSATAAQFGPRRRGRVVKLAVPAVLRALRLARSDPHRRIYDGVIAARAEAGLDGWALEQVRQNEPRAMLEAGAAILRFESVDWISRLDLPAAVVVTTNDTTVSPRLQARLSRSLPQATTHHAVGDHAMVVADPGSYLPCLLDALASVRARIEP